MESPHGRIIGPALHARSRPPKPDKPPLHRCHYVLVSEQRLHSSSHGCQQSNTSPTEHSSSH
eukprot:8347107-Prorocentrum_lima.AAC.1